MRTEFAEHMKMLATENDRIVFLTGDLGFMALESLQAAMGSRFINVGVSEQNMVTMSASLAYEGLIPVCYSIAPFITLRPAEQIKVDVCLHGLNVKLAGNGGGYGYGIMGATHHALEDLAVLSSFQHMRCFIPFCNEDVKGVMNAMFNHEGPSYLRLGYGFKPHALAIPAVEPVRWLAGGDQVTIVCLGSAVLNALSAMEQLADPGLCDVFVVTEIPLVQLPSGLLASLGKTGKLLILEEHVRRGGMGENLALLLLEKQLTCHILHRYALGYPDGYYGDIGYHLKKCGLDAESIKNDINSLLSCS